MSEGHYNSVPSAEACQLDCQVDHDDNDGDLDNDGDANDNDDAEGHYNSVPSGAACQQDCQVDADHDVDADLDLNADHCSTVPFMVLNITHNITSTSCHCIREGVKKKNVPFSSLLLLRGPVGN